MEFSEVIKSELIKLDMEAKTKEEALAELVDLLYQNNVLSDKGSFLDDVYEREKMGMTGIGNHIAIPHGKSVSVKKTSLAIGRTKTEIQWETLDDEPVQFIILFAVSEEDKTSVHLNLLTKVAKALGNDEVCQSLMAATVPDQILEIFISAH